MPSCAVYDCKNNDQNKKDKQIAFFHFPKDAKIRKKWEKVCRRKDKINFAEDRICSSHFSQSDIANYMQWTIGKFRPILQKGAIPNFSEINEQSDETTPRAARRKKRSVRINALHRLQNLSKHGTQKEQLMLMIADCNAQATTDNQSAAMIQKNQPEVTPVATTSVDVNTAAQDNQETVPMVVTISCQSELVADLQKKIELLTYEKNQLEKRREKDKKTFKIKDLEVKKLENQKNQLQQDATKWKNKWLASNKQHKQDLKAEENSAVLKKVFSAAQIRFLKSKKNKKMVHWDKDDIMKAISVRALSIKTYQYIRNKLNIPLPGLTTIRRRWAADFKCDPGILTSILDLLKNQNFEINARYCVLSFDEMKIDSRMQYDRESDRIFGPHSNVQIAMIKGLCAKWKQHIYYNFDETMTKEILLEIIEKLESECNLHVVACVSDLGGTNNIVWNELGVNHVNSSFKHPVHKDENIWVFPDFPYLLKFLRNHFLDDGIKLPSGRILNKEIIETLLVKTHNELKTCYHITRHHIHLQGRDRQRVAEAAKLFSHKTAVALGRYLNDEEASEVFKVINDTFDVFNSSIPVDQKNKVKSGYGNYLKQQNEILENMDQLMFYSRFGEKRELLPCQQGVLQAIKSLRGLHQDMKGKKIDYLLTRRLNQDCLEHTFSDIRGTGQSDSHPLPAEFKNRLRLLLLGANCGDLSKGRVIEVQDGEPNKLLSSSILSKAIPQTEDTEETDEIDNSSAQSTSIDEFDDIRQLLQEYSNSRTSEPNLHSSEIEQSEQDGLEYISGYIAFRCNDVDNSLGKKISHFCPSSAPSWLKLISSNDGLFEPSENWLQLVKEFEVLFCQLHGTYINKSKGIIKELQNIISKKYPAVHKKIICCYSKVRTFIRIRALNTVRAEKK